MELKHSTLTAANDTAVPMSPSIELRSHPASIRCCRASGLLDLTAVTYAESPWLSDTSRSARAPTRMSMTSGWLHCAAQCRAVRPCKSASLTSAWKLIRVRTAYADAVDDLFLIANISAVVPFQSYTDIKQGSLTTGLNTAKQNTEKNKEKKFRAKQKCKIRPRAHLIASVIFWHMHKISWHICVVIRLAKYSKTKIHYNHLTKVNDVTHKQCKTTKHHFLHLDLNFQR